jgi:glutamine amidotransferase
VPVDRSLIAGYSLYPVPFTCAVARGTLFAVQFHPEKSQEAGLRLLSNFVRWDGRHVDTRRAAELPLTRD